MDLSIIIVNFNTKKLILNCVESITISKPKIKYEIIVVDNGSSEKIETSDFVNYGVKIIKNDSNLGFAKANNQGIRKAKGKYIVLLNSDTRVKKYTIDRLYEFAKSKSEAGVIAPRLLNPDGSVQGSVFRFPTIGRAIKQYWLGKKGLLEKYAPGGNEAHEVEAVVGAAFLITPEAFNKVGLLDERYFMYFEDLDYCRRVRQNGLKTYYLPKAEVIHYHGESGRKILDAPNQWRRLIPSSKIYHGIIVHNIIFFITWASQKVAAVWRKVN